MSDRTCESRSTESTPARRHIAAGVIHRDASGTTRTVATAPDWQPTPLPANGPARRRTVARREW